MDQERQLINFYVSNQGTLQKFGQGIFIGDARGYFSKSIGKTMREIGPVVMATGIYDNFTLETIVYMDYLAETALVFNGFVPLV